MAIIGILKSCERAFGSKGQEVVGAALRDVGLDVGRQILQGCEIPESMTEAEFFSFYATVINRIAYASLERPRVDAGDKVTFDIAWCPHQDHYQAFDCRVQRYFVEGMIAAAREHGQARGWQVRFDSTIPAGAATCHFTLWKANESEQAEWERYTKSLEQKAIAVANDGKTSTP